MIELVVLDVNETLFPLDPIASRMAEVGLEGQLEVWFTRILRDGLDGLVAEVHDVSEVRRWKPAPDAYRHVAAQHGVPTGRTAMIAVHPWICSERKPPVW